MNNTERNFNTLPSGKKLGIYKIANTALYKIAFTSGGELPKELQGAFTDAYQAQRAIGAYLTRVELAALKAEQEDSEEAPEVAEQPAKKKAAKKKAAKKTKE